MPAEQHKRVDASNRNTLWPTWKTAKRIDGVNGGLGSSPGALECETEMGEV